jgi:hypothetical protein
VLSRLRAQKARVVFMGNWIVEKTSFSMSLPNDNDELGKPVTGDDPP